MNTSFITCPCCGQTIYISYSELFGFSATHLDANYQDGLRRLLSQVACNQKELERRYNEQIMSQNKI